MDPDGDGIQDSWDEGRVVPLWVDKSNSNKNAIQSVPSASPVYARSVFDAYPAIRFASGDSFNVGSLNLNVGNIHEYFRH